MPRLRDSAHAPRVALMTNNQTGTATEPSIRICLRRPPRENTEYNRSINRCPPVHRPPSILTPLCAVPHPAIYFRPDPDSSKR